MVRDTSDLQEVHTDISQYWYELYSCYSLLSPLYPRSSRPHRHTMSRREDHTPTGCREIVTLRIRSVYDLWAHEYECDKGVVMEYGRYRYRLGYYPHHYHRYRDVYCPYTIYLMRKFVILLSILFLVSLDLGSKIFIEDTVFGSWKGICQAPSLNSTATREYCDENTLSLTPWFGIHLSYNPGIAFSLPITGLPLQILTIILIIGLIYFFFTEEYPKWSRLLDAAYVLILAWALSHGYERIFVWHVVDFISVRYFAILNFADIFISIGAFLIVSYYVYHRREHR